MQFLDPSNPALCEVVELSLEVYILMLMEKEKGKIGQVKSIKDMQSND